MAVRKKREREKINEMVANDVLGLFSGMLSSIGSVKANNDEQLINCEHSYQQGEHDR
jgi:hypothetical protein